MIKRTALVVVSVVAALSIVGCSALLGRGDPTPCRSTQDARAASCEIVRTQWGQAMDPWRHLWGEDSDFQGFAKTKTDHQAIIDELQIVADRVEDPDVHGILETSIDVHQQIADDIWDSYDALAGQPIHLDDPKDPTNVVSGRFVAYQDALLAADIERYDLCGAVQDGQTAEEACEIATGDWVDAGVKFNNSGGGLQYDDDVTQEEIDAVVDSVESALHLLKVALVKVTEPGVLKELEDGYEAYQAYLEDGVKTLQPTAAVLKMTDEEFDAYQAVGEAAFTAWDTRLNDGTENLKTICGAFD